MLKLFTGQEKLLWSVTTVRGWACLADVLESIFIDGYWKWNSGNLYLWLDTTTNKIHLINHKYLGVKIFDSILTFIYIYLFSWQVLLLNLSSHTKKPYCKGSHIIIQREPVNCVPSVWPRHDSATGVTLLNTQRSACLTNTLKPNIVMHRFPINNLVVIFMGSIFGNDMYNLFCHWLMVLEVICHDCTDESCWVLYNNLMTATYHCDTGI